MNFRNSLSGQPQEKQVWSGRVEFNTTSAGYEFCIFFPNSQVLKLYLGALSVQNTRFCIFFLNWCYRIAIDRFLYDSQTVAEATLTSI